MLKRLIEIKIREDKKDILSTILNNKYFYKKNDKRKYHIKYMNNVFLLKYYGLNKKRWFYEVLEYSSLIFEINNDIIINNRE